MYEVLETGWTNCEVANTGSSCPVSGDVSNDYPCGPSYCRAVPS